MKHMLMDPAFPDLVAAAAAEPRQGELKDWRRNAEPAPVADAFMIFLAKLEVASTRLW